MAPRRDRDGICKFYCDVLGGKLMKSDPERDFIRLDDDFYVVFFYGDVADDGEFLRSGRCIWLEIKSDNVEEMTRKILACGARKLEVPAPHLFFQAPGGQCFRLVGIDEDLSFYEGAGGEGTDVAKVKEALGGMPS
jgi:catechol 2,3-dioxygenase-like lactoylglutathione lyase family enzyme